MADTANDELPADLKESDFDFSIVEREPITEFAAEETYDIVVVGAGCAGVPAVLTAVEEGAKVACLQKEAVVSANGNGCSFVAKEHSTPAGIKRWRSDWARLNDWRINNDLFDYYVEYAEEAVPWVISQGRSVGIEPIEFLTDSSIRYDDGSVVAVCDATQASNQDLMTALAQKAADGGATFYYETPCVQLVQEEDVGLLPGDGPGRAEDAVAVPDLGDADDVLRSQLAAQEGDAGQPQAVREVLDNGGLADARRAPDEHRADEPYVQKDVQQLFMVYGYGQVHEI